MPQLTIDIAARLAQFQDSLDRVGKDAERTAKRIDGAFSGLKTAAAGVGFGLVVRELTQFVKAGIDAADEIGKMAQKVGLSVESLSALKYAAELSDVSMESLATSMKKLSVNMVEMQAGGGESAAAFKALGISVESSKGVLKTSEQVLFEIADKFEAMRDGAGKSALAVKLFGRAGVEMIPLLNGGAKGLRDSADEAKRFGIIISTEAAKAAEKFNDDMKRLAQTSEALKISLAGGLLPALTGITERLLEGQRIAGGFGKYLLLLGNANINPGNAGERIAEITKQLEALQKARDNAPRNASARDFAKIDAEIEDAKKRLEFAKYVQRQTALAQQGGDTPGERARMGVRDVPKAEAPGLPDEAAIKRSEQLLEKFRDKLAGIQDEIAKASGIDSMTLAVKRLLDTDKDFKEIGKDPQKRQQLLDAAEMLDVTKAMKEQEKERVEAIQAGAEEAQKWRNEETLAVIALRDQLDPLRARNREIAQMLLLVNQGRISWKEFNDAALDPRLRELLKPLKNDFTILNTALKEGDITLQQYLTAVEQLRGKLDETNDTAADVGRILSSSFEDAATSGEKFGDVLKALDRDLAKLLLRKAVTEPLDKAITRAMEGFDFGKIFGGGSSASIPSFDVGTDFVPRDTLAFVHKGERIVPAAENRSGNWQGSSVVINQSIHVDARADRASIDFAMMRSKEQAKAEIIELQRRGATV